MENEKKYFYVDGRSGEVAGPCSLEELQRLQYWGKFEERLSEETMVAEEGTEDWMPFGEIGRLATAAEERAKKEREVAAQRLAAEQEWATQRLAAEQEAAARINAEEARTAAKKAAEETAVAEKVAAEKAKADEANELDGTSAFRSNNVFWLRCICFLLMMDIGLVPLALIQKNWVYTTVSPSDSSFTSEMDSLGRQGWELVTARRAVNNSGSGIFSSSSASYECIMKRRRSWFN